MKSLRDGSRRGLSGGFWGIQLMIKRMWKKESIVKSLRTDIYTIVKIQGHGIFRVGFCILGMRKILKGHFSVILQAAN